MERSKQDGTPCFAPQTGGVLTALTLLCLANAHASVRMYVIWQPVQDSPTWQRADSGATIGGVFQVRVVVQPNSGYLYGVTVVENSISEVADHYSGQTTMGDFASVASNPSYGDPTSNVAVLQSTHLFLPHNATYRLRVRVRYWVIPPYPPQPFQEEAEMLITQRNLEVVDNRPEGWFAWDPATMTEVPFSVELRHAQQGSCTVHVHITHICQKMLITGKAGGSRHIG